MQEQMGNVSREMETLRKNQKEMLIIKNTITEMENVFDGSISRLDMTQERISMKYEDMSIETSKTKIQGGRKNEKDGTEYPRL